MIGVVGWIPGKEPSTSLVLFGPQQTLLRAGNYHLNYGGYRQIVAAVIIGY